MSEITGTDLVRLLAELAGVVWQQGVVQRRELLAARLDVGVRTLARWEAGASRPRTAEFGRLCGTLRDRYGVSEDRLAELRALQERMGPLSPAAWQDLTALLGVSRSNVEQTLIEVQEQAERRRLGATRLPLPARCTRLASGRRLLGSTAPDAVDTVLRLLLHDPETPVRAVVRGPLRSGRRWTCQEVAAALARDFLWVEDPQSITPLPIVADWDLWIERLRGRATQRDEDAAQALLHAADLPAASEGHAWRALRSGQCVVVLLRQIDQQVEPARAPAAVRLLEGLPRLLTIDAVGSAMGNALTHRIDLLVPLLPHDVGAILRARFQRLRHAPLRLGDFGGMLKALAWPALAMRALALVEIGHINEHTLASEAAFLAALVADVLMRRRTRANGVSLEVPLSVLPQLDADPGRMDDPLQKLLPGIWGWLRADNLDREGLLGDLDPLREEREALRTEEGRARLLQRRFEDARRDPAAWFPEARDPKDGSLVIDGLDGAMALLDLVLAPAERDPWTTDEVWSKIDPYAARMLGATLRARRPQILPQVRGEVRSVVARVVAALEEDRSSLEVWKTVATEWERFMAALGLLSSLAAGDDELDGLRQRTVEALRDQFSPRREKDQDRGGRGNLRYHAARAAAILLIPTDVAAELRRLAPRIERDSNGLEAIRHVIFWSEAAARLRSLPDSQNQDLEAALVALVEIPPERCGAAAPEYRHARYHVANALERLAPTPRVLRCFQRSVLAYLREQGKDPPDAVVAATAVGYLTRHGVLFAERPTMEAWRIARAAVREVDGVYGEAEERRIAPAYVRAHVYLALESVAPSMARVARQELLERVMEHGGAIAPERIADPYETAATRYLLYWLLGEARAGIPFPEALQRFLRGLAQRFELNLDANRRLSLEVPTARLLQAVLDHAGISEFQAGS